MTSLLHLVSRKINAINEITGKITAWLTVLLVALVCFDVVARKIFNFSRVWIMDLEWHFFALIFLLAAGYALKHGRHVRVDLFYANYSKKDKALTDFWGTLLFLIPWSIVVIVYSWGYALQSFHLQEGASEPGGLPARWVIKFCITLGITLLFLQAIALLIDAALILLDKTAPETEDEAREEFL